jgi:3-oxoacyl-[acyl-carrier-protein] synthase-1
MDESAVGMPIVTERQDNIDINLAMSNNFGFGGTNACLVMKKFNE